MTRWMLIAAAAGAVSAAGAPAPASANMAACSSAAVKEDPADRVRLYTLCIEGGISRGNRAGAYNNRGVAQLALGEVDKAYRDFSRSIEYDPKFAMAYLNRARIEEARGEYEAAIADLDEAVRWPPARVRSEAYTLRGVLHANQGNLDQAIEDFDEAIRRKRREPAPKLWKAWILSTADDAAYRDGAQAVELAEAAMEETDGGWPREVLSSAYAAEGRFGDAARELARAIAYYEESGGEAGFNLEYRLKLYRDEAVRAGTVAGSAAPEPAASE